MATHKQLIELSKNQELLLLLGSAILHDLCLTAHLYDFEENEEFDLPINGGDMVELVMGEVHKLAEGKQDVWRCTREQPYGPGTPGHEDTRQRQGYYIHAYNRHHALKIMAQKFPHDTAGFTVEWHAE